MAAETNCRYDVRVVNGNGHAAERPKPDICRREPLVFDGKSVTVGQAK